MTAMQDRVINVISREPAQRTNPEIDILLPWLRKKSQLLQSMEKHVIMDIIRNCQYQKNNRDDVIIKQGDRGDRFYIILAGSVSVFVDAIKSGEDELAAAAKTPPSPADKKQQTAKEKAGEGTKREPSTLDEKKKADEEKQEIGTPEPEVQLFPPPKEKKLDRSLFGKYVIKFGTGKSFGEIALISSDNVRNASIIADEDCHFLVIHRDLYNRSLKAFQEQEYADRKAFVENHPLFCRWSARFRRLLEMSITKEVFTFDSVIQRQGDPVNGLIFIRKGRGKVIVEPGRHSQQYPHMYPFPHENDIYELEHLRPSKKPLGEVQTNARSNVAVKNEQTAVRRREGYAAAEKKILYRSIALCSVEEGEVLGDVEMIMGMDGYMQTVVTTSYTEVYVLNNKNIERLVTKKNPSTVDLLRMMVETKLQSRIHSQQGAQVPLLKHAFFKLVDEIRPPPKKPPPPLRGTKELPDRDVLMQHLFDVFSQNKAALVEPYVPGAIYYREMMRDKARIRLNIRKRRAAQMRKDKMRTYVKAVTKFPRSTAKIKASLEEEQREEEEKMVEEIRKGQEEQRKSDLSKALSGVNPFQLLTSQNLPPIFKNELKPPTKEQLPDRATIEPKQQLEKLPKIKETVKTMSKVRHKNKDTKQVLQVNKPVFVTEHYSPSPVHYESEISINNIESELRIKSSGYSPEEQNNNIISCRDKNSVEEPLNTEPVNVSSGDVNCDETLVEKETSMHTPQSHGKTQDQAIQQESHSGRNIPKGGKQSKPASPDDISTSHVEQSVKQNGDNQIEDPATVQGKDEYDTVTLRTHSGQDEKIIHNASSKSNIENGEIQDKYIPSQPTEKEERESVKETNDIGGETVAENINHGEPLLPPIASFIKQQHSKQGHQNGTSSPNEKQRMKFVNTYVQHRLRVIHENPIYRDWETSDKTLSFLEERIKNFHMNTDSSGSASAKHKGGVTLPKLKRYQVQEGDLKQPKPGGKVWMKLKPCRLMKTKGTTGHHQHHRYEMVPKIPDFERLKRTRMLLHFFMDQTIDKKMNHTS